MAYINLYYLDESHFGRSLNVGYTSQPKDTRILLPPSKGKWLRVPRLRTSNCKLFSKIFKRAIDFDGSMGREDKFCQTICERTIVVIDNMFINPSKKFMVKIIQWEQQGLWTSYFPPYAPKLNTIKILWLTFDTFLNVQHLKDQLNDTLSKDNSKSILNFY